MDKRWVFKNEAKPEDVDLLSSALTIDKTLAGLLAQREVHTFEQAKSFFRPQLSDLHDPFLMKDMDIAIDRIKRAFDNNEKILIYGDYDVDGTTSVALVYAFFKERYSNIEYYIPDRYSEGYGISSAAIDYAAENKISLIIALDCGIKAVNRIADANKLNIDFIICDHHLPGDEIPNALAVLDPKREDCNYPFDQLSGCGVGFKLIQGYAIINGIPFDEVIPFLDLVSVSIASDIVPVIGENRILAHFGLKQLNDNPRIGLRTIIDLACMAGNKITIEDIVFKIGPRINAAGRMETGKKAVDLLIAEDEKQAFLKAKKINICNDSRKNVDRNITQEALKMISSNEELLNRKSTVLYDSDWHKGVLGIVASRLTETYYRPTVVLTESNGLVTGSARSVNGYDLYQAVEACADLLENFGGHMYAAGLTMKEENIPEFERRFEEAVSNTITEDQLIPQIEIDAKIDLKEITPKFYRILEQFEPFGPGNMSPVFLTEDVVDNGESRLVGAMKEHLKLSLIQEENPFQSFGAIAFQQGSSYKKIRTGNPFSVCYSIEQNTFLGKSSIQLKIKDIKISTANK